ncbi:MAG: hypothetical protein FWF06_00980 [Symbiobacteriaceae bacterium]|nr:hypothetical protein [Symbiobacteriaceae bacterium]
MKKVSMFHLQALYSFQRFLIEDRGDQQTGWLIGVIVSVVFGGLIMKGVNDFWPVLWPSITGRISSLLTP